MSVESFREAISPRSRAAPADWCAREVRPEGSSWSARYDLASTPWFEEPLNETFNNANNQIVVTGPVGCGKTGFIEAVACCIVAEHPGPTLIAGQTDDDIGAWAEERLWKVFRRCKPVAALLPERNKCRKMEHLFAHMSMHLTGANMSGFQGKSKRWCLGDEVWMWGQGLRGEFEKRTHRRWNGRVILLGQAGFRKEDGDGEILGDDFTIAHDEGEQREWCFACPQCGDVQPYRREQLQYPEEGSVIERSAEVVYECANCKTAWADQNKVRRKFAASARYEVTRGPKLQGRISFHLNVLALWRSPWADFVAQWILANRAMKQGNPLPLQQVVQKELAEPWREELTVVVDVELPRDQRERGDFADGQTMEGEVVRFATIDVQRDHFWLMIRAWGAEAESLGIYYGRVFTEETLVTLVEQYGVPAEQVFIDTGYDSGRVYDMIVRNGWCGIRGDKTEHYLHLAGPPSRRRKIYRYYSKMYYATAPKGGRARYFYLAADNVKNVLHRLRQGEGASWRVVGDIGGEYEEGIDSEKREEFVDRKTRTVTRKWVTKRKNNHPWDLEYYQVGAALVWRLFVDEAQGRSATVDSD